MNSDLFKREGKFLQHLKRLVQVDGFLMDTQNREIVLGEPSKCEGCKNERCCYINTHLYGSSEAYRWNGRYIYYCHEGLVFIASPIPDSTGNMCGSVILGPMVMNEDLIDCGVPFLTTAQVNDLAEVLAANTSYAANMPHSKVGSFVYEQEEILKEIYNIRDIYSDTKQIEYPIEYEKRLQKMIATRDKAGSQKLLNELLGHIFLMSDFNITLVKARVIELLVVLSRATIDAGADINEIFCINNNYIGEIEKFNTIEDLSAWITGIMHRFINYSFDFTEVKHSDIIYKTMTYIKANYMNKLSLDEISNVVYLSKSYLSKIFKEETGVSLTSYINQVRVEKSKDLLVEGSLSLVDIANFCGFEDQSYFSKVFKKETGVSPKSFKSNRGVK